MSSVTPLSSFRKTIIGVLVRESIIISFHRQTPPVRMAVIENANNQAQTTLYFFSAKDIDLNKKKITGTYFNKKSVLWEKKTFPYPDVFYKKGYVTPSLRGTLSKFEEQLKKMKVKNLNYLTGFNKWQVYEELGKDKDFRNYIPHTILYQKQDDLKRMLDNTGKVYLKACRGGRGRQVIRVIHLPEGGYEYSCYIHRLHVKKVKTFKNLMDQISNFYGNRKFVIQEAIDLITIDKSIIDMRAEVQKDGEGKITLAAVPVRVSQSNSPITTHASSYPFEYFFKTIMKYSDAEIEDLKERLSKFLVAAFQSIEKSFGPTGEIGIDVGLDKQGRLWFIECNSRSMKVSLFNAYDKTTINNSFVNLLEYAKFIHQH